MRYLLIEDGIIANIIEADEGIAAEWGLNPDYKGAEIGAEYNPPPDPVPPTLEDVVQENRVLKAQVEALTQVCDFHEELIVELAQEVYA